MLRAVERRMWFGPTATVIGGPAFAHRAGFGRLLLPRPPVVNSPLRMRFKGEDRVLQSLRHEMGHLQALPAALAYAAGILAAAAARSARALFWLFLICASTPAALAQEQVVGVFTVNFGVISWEQIQKGLPERPASHVEEYHYKMARQMATMHGGGGKGDFHVLVVIDNAKTGQRVDKADVRVKVIGPGHLPRSVRLQPMTMDGFAGFGEFVHIGSGGTYTFKVLFRLSETEPFMEADFVETILE